MGPPARHEHGTTPWRLNSRSATPHFDIGVGGGNGVPGKSSTDFGNGAQWAGVALAKDGVPVNLPPLDALERARLEWRPISRQAAPFGPRRVYARGPGGEVRAVEPPGSPFAVRWLALVLLPAALGVALYLPLRSVGRQLGELVDTAQRLQAGDATARASPGPPGPVRAVAEQLNSMADEVQRMLEGQQELLESVSHELRTPVARLFFLLDHLQALEGPGDAPERARLTEQCHANLMELRALTAELLEYVSLGADPGERAEAVDLLAAARACVDSAEVPCELIGGPCWVAADDRMLRRCVRNLLLNALRYGEGQVRITVSADAGHGLLAVEDDGPGVPVADRHRVFEPFVRLEGSRSRATGGAGLGLAIVRRAARRLGGDCRVKDAASGGARFELRLPLI